jgi:branched-chain amino acid transport system substrate-binding protein
MKRSRSLLLLAGPLATAAIPTARASAADAVKIGVVLPLGGQFGDFIKHQILNPIKLAADDRNAKGGVLGRQIEYVVEDTKFDAASAVAAMQKLIDVDKVSIIVTASTPITMPMLPVAAERKILVLSYSTEYPAMTKSPWAVRATPMAGQDSVILARAAIKAGAKTTAVLSEVNEAIGVSVQQYSDAFTKLGGKIAAQETFNREDTDMRGQLTKLRSANADAFLLLSTSGRSAALAFKQMSEVGFRPKRIFSNPNANDPAIADAGVTDATEGTVFASALIQPAFTARFAKVEGYDISSVGARNYDGSNILFDAIQRAKTTDSTKVRDAIYNYGTFMGVAGKYVFHGNGQPDVDPVLFVIKGGKAVPYTG